MQLVIDLSACSYIFLREQLMLYRFWFDMGVDLQVRFQKGQYMFATFCNGTNVCLCIKPPKGTSVTQCMRMRIYVYASV